MTFPRPTPAEEGFEVTICIVALTQPFGTFVSVTDRKVSYDDELPADENAIIKNLQLSNNWSVTFSADNIESAITLLDKVRHRIIEPAETMDSHEMKSLFASAIFDTIQEDFFNRRLGRYGYKSVEQFRQEGRADLGDHYFELCRELDKADVGVGFIVYGYNTFRAPQLFEVDGQGRITDRMAIRYAVIGSGYSIASTSLKLKPLAADFDSMVYRVLEAKFYSETGASGIGRPTTVTFKMPDQHDFMMGPGDIEKIRNIWEQQKRLPESPEAAEITGKIRMDIIEGNKKRAEFLRSTGRGS